MSNDEDDDLGIDLDAWQPPPVPGGIADAVVAQMRQEQTAITTVTAIETSRPGARRYWIAGLAFAAATGAAAFVAFGIERRPSSSAGTVLADRPTHIALAKSSADVEPGAYVRWNRGSYDITAEQGGTATWRVTDDDKLKLSVGVGEIRATTNTSMRVEVKMIDSQQIKTIATSGITAAAVALVTIVVYEGAVKTTDNTGKETMVAAGATYQIKGNTVIEEEASLVGSGPTLEQLNLEELKAALAAKEEEIDRLKRALEPDSEDKLDRPAINDLYTRPRPHRPATVDRDLYTNPPAQPATLDRDEIANTMRGLTTQIQACSDGFAGKVFVTVNVNADGSVESVKMSPADVKPAKCVADVVRSAKFATAPSATLFKYPFVFTAPATPPCEADLLLRKGQDAYSNNDWRTALQAFEALYKCKPDSNSIKFAFASACKSRNVAKAKLYWSKMNHGMRDTTAPICVGNGITIDQLDGAVASTGQLRVNGPPDAEIFVDGKKIGRNSISIDIDPGKHKVMFQAGDDKHTFSVVVKVGETITLDKHDLQ